MKKTVKVFLQTLELHNCFNFLPKPRVLQQPQGQPPEEKTSPLEYAYCLKVNHS